MLTVSWVLALRWQSSFSIWRRCSLSWSRLAWSSLTLLSWPDCRHSISESDPDELVFALEFGCSPRPFNWFSKTLTCSLWPNVIKVRQLYYINVHAAHRGLKKKCRQSTNFWLLHMSLSMLVPLSIYCWSSANQVLTEYWLGCRSRVSIRGSDQHSTTDAF